MEGERGYGIGWYIGIDHGGRRQVVKAAACGAAIRGFESPRSPFLLVTAR